MTAASGQTPREIKRENAKIWKNTTNKSKQCAEALLHIKICEKIGNNVLIKPPRAAIEWFRGVICFCVSTAENIIERKTLVAFFAEACLIFEG